MTAQQVLDKVLEAGGKVIPDPDRPRLVIPSALRSLVAEHREGIRELVLQGSGRSLSPCGSPKCAGCYLVMPGVSIHPPATGRDWQDWLRRWQPGWKERLQ